MRLSSKLWSSSISLALMGFLLFSDDALAQKKKSAKSKKAEPAPVVEPPPAEAPAPEVMDAPDEPADLTPEVDPAADAVGEAPPVEAESKPVFVFKPGTRAAQVCKYNDKTESYGCPSEGLEHFNVKSDVRVASPSDSLLKATAVYDDESGCLLALDIDFGQSSAERRVAWKNSSLIVSGKETDFYVQGSSGDIEPSWETGTLIVPNAPMKESIVERKGKCLIDLLDEEQSRDSFFVDIEIEETGQATKHRVEVERSWVSTTIVEVAHVLPEPTEPLPSPYWPWIVGGLGVCGVAGCCAGPACLFSSVYGLGAVIAGIGVAINNQAIFSLGIGCFAIGIPIMLYGTLPTGIVGLLVGMASGAGIGYGIAAAMESSFPDDKESDARWLAWRAFRQKHGVPMKGPKLDLPKKASTAMAH